MIRKGHLERLPNGRHRDLRKDGYQLAWRECIGGETGGIQHAAAEEERTRRYSGDQIRRESEPARGKPGFQREIPITTLVGESRNIRRGVPIEPLTRRNLDRTLCIVTGSEVYSIHIRSHQAGS